MRSIAARTDTPTSSGTLKGRTARDWVSAACLALVAIGYPVVRLFIAASEGPLQLRQDLADDYYYYGSIAQHMAHGAGSTYGGLTSTNGYQPLWQLVLVPVAGVAHGDAFLLLTLAIQGVLYCITVILAWKICQALSAQLEGWLAGAYTATIALLFGRFFFNGMETAVVLTAIFGFILYIVTLHRSDAQHGRYKQGVIGGVLTSLLFLSRLDTIALPVCVAVPLLAAGTRAIRRTVVVAGIVTAAVVIGYLAVNEAIYRTALPVSGQAKALGGRGSLSDDVLGYLRFGSSGPFSHLYLGVQATVVGLAALGILLYRRNAVMPLLPGKDNALVLLIASIQTAVVIDVAYYTLTSSWPLESWYFYYIPAEMFLGGIVVLRFIRQFDAGRIVFRPAVAILTAVASVISCLFIYHRTLGTGETDYNWRSASPRVAAWIAEKTEPGSVVAVGDRAGMVGWLDKRPTLQLEGLVEDPSYLHNLRAHNIAQRMIELHVSYYARSDDDADRARLRQPVAGHPGCWAVLEPTRGGGPKSTVRVCDADRVYQSRQADGSTWEVWRFIPSSQ